MQLSKLRNGTRWLRGSAAAATLVLSEILTPPIALAKPSFQVPYSPKGWVHCARQLLLLSKVPDADSILLDMRSYSSVTSSDFLSYLHAMAYVESRFNSNAVSGAGAVGFLQLTSVGAQDAAAECSLPCPVLSSLKDRRRNILYSSCLLKKYLREAGGNWKLALILYNGGYVQLYRHSEGLDLTLETEEYVRNVLRIRQICLH